VKSYFGSTKKIQRDPCKNYFKNYFCPILIPFNQKGSILNFSAISPKITPKDSIWEKFERITDILTVSISLNQQLAIQAKSYFWPKCFIQPSETQKTQN
jgi:hypothetical protein